MSRGKRQFASTEIPPGATPLSGADLRRERELLELTQAALAVPMECSQQRISQLEALPAGQVTKELSNRYSAAIRAAVFTPAAVAAAALERPRVELAFR